jgi:EAL domain-containing protein (putative c-di-GMP-specific phosphodiesterase class I)
MAIGLEAQGRWMDPEPGMVSPGELIPIAEDTGLIVQIGEWVLNESCRRAAEWSLSVPMTVRTGNFNSH